MRHEPLGVLDAEPELSRGREIVVDELAAGPRWRAPGSLLLLLASSHVVELGRCPSRGIRRESRLGRGRSASVRRWGSRPDSSVSAGRRARASKAVARRPSIRHLVRELHDFLTGGRDREGPRRRGSGCGCCRGPGADFAGPPPHSFSGQRERGEMVPSQRPVPRWQRQIQRSNARTFWDSKPLDALRSPKRDLERRRSIAHS